MELLARAAAAAAPSCSTAHPALHLPHERVPAPRRSRPPRPGFPSLRAAAAAAAIAVEPETKVQQKSSSDTEVFACPVCYEPLIRKGPPGINLPAIYRSGFKCSKCNKSFTSKDIFLDLTVTSGTIRVSLSIAAANPSGLSVQVMGLYMGLPHGPEYSNTPPQSELTGAAEFKTGHKKE